MLKNLISQNHATIAQPAVLPQFVYRREASLPCVHFNDGPCVENPLDGKSVNVRFMLGDHCEYETVLQPGHWAKADKKYAVDWRIDIADIAGAPIHTHLFESTGKRVRINIDSQSLGDTLAWMPQIERYRQQHPNTHVFVSQFWSSLGFADHYPELNFIEPDEPLEGCYATYNLGFYFESSAARHPVNPRTVPLAKVASDILGIQYQETRPRIKTEQKERRIKGPYVCIATTSTANCKHWLFEGGWQFVIDQLVEMGFSVVVIQKEPAAYRNVIDHAGDRPIQERITDLLHCEFFIGLGSGLSWLAWALQKPVVLISGFSQSFAEFTDGCYRVSNEKVCNGCWNDTGHTFDRGDWNWCPRLADTGRQFECSRLITPDRVMSGVLKLLQDQCMALSLI